MSLISIEHYTERQQRAAQRVLESLARMELRLQQRQFRQHRRHERVPYRSTALLCLSEADGEVLDPLPAECCRVWTSSLSRTGLSFIYPQRLAMGELIVGLPLEDGRHVWLRAEVMRTREIADDGFWEYGLRFRGRLGGELAAPAGPALQSRE